MRRTQKLEAAIDQSFVAGFRTIMLVTAALAVAGALTSWLMIDGKTDEEAQSGV